MQATLIELTEQQVTELGHPDGTPRRVVNPRTKERPSMLPTLDACLKAALVLP